MNRRPSFAITSFHIEGFRGIKNTSVEDIPAQTKWIFLTGKNGSGKTSVLQALFVGLLGKKEGKITLEDGDYKITGTLTTTGGKELIFIEEGSEQKNHTHGLSGWAEANDFLIEKFVVAYGAIRTQIQNGTNLDSPDKFLKSKSLFEGGSPLLNIEQELKNWTYRSSSDEVKKQNIELANRLKERAQKLNAILLKLMPNLQKIVIDAIEDKVRYFEKDDQGKALNTAKTFNQLAAGNRSIIAMIGDMIIRLFQVQDNISNPSDLEGVVLIDELDVHLHPTWQKTLPSLLSEIFPKIQFIASTHSPIPLLGAPKGSVVMKVQQSSSTGITIDKLDIDVTKLLPNSILTSPIFDLEDIIPTNNTRLKDLHTEDTFQEAMANEEIKKRLTKIAQTLK